MIIRYGDDRHSLNGLQPTLSVVPHKEKNGSCYPPLLYRRWKGRRRIMRRTTHVRSNATEVVALLVVLFSAIGVVNVSSAGAASAQQTRMQRAAPSARSADQLSDRERASDQWHNLRSRVLVGSVPHNKLVKVTGLVMCLTGVLQLVGGLSLVGDIQRTE